jgi:hypothetical protein
MAFTDLIILIPLFLYSHALHAIIMALKHSVILVKHLDYTDTAKMIIIAVNG